MIHIIEGAAGTGKTHRLFEIFCKLAREGCDKLLYLIPEQSSFECETAFLRLLGPALARNINVMSFTRLYSFVMGETGGIASTAIDDSTRKLLMACTLEDCSENLNIYSKPAAGTQFIETALTAVKEFKQCGVSPEMLRQAAADADSAELEHKLGELALIYDLYNANIAQSGIDPLDNDMRLYERLLESGFLNGWIIAADDFSGFTAVQMKLIEVMMKQSSEFYISLCLDPLADHDVFFTVSKTRQRILECAKKQGIKASSPVRLLKNYRCASAALLHLEGELYRSEQDDAAELSLDADGEITVVRADNIYDECEYIAARINDLALSGLCRYRDIAVVMRDTGKYEGVIDSVFDKHGVPYFMSRPEPIDNKPIIRLALTALEFALSPNDERKFLDSLKSGLMGASAYSIAKLENYVFVWGLRGRDLMSEFTLDPEGYSDGLDQKSERTLKELNDVRLKAAVPFSALLGKLSSGGSFTARDISLAVYEFMVDCGVPGLLKQRARENAEFSDEGLRLWTMLCDILNKMHEALGQRMISLRRYCELFRIVIKGADISDIPQTLDQVTIGKADSVRLNSPYAVFAVGAVENEFPRRPVADGVFTDAQRGRLISLGLPLYDTVTDLWRQEKFFVYSALSSARRRLYVSFPKSTATGDLIQPSSIVSEILRIFPAEKIIETDDVPDIMRISNDRTAFESYARNHRRGGALPKALQRYLDESGEFSDRLKVIGRSVKNIDECISDRGTTAAVFGTDKRFSPSQIERYYQCRFNYFCNYGLHLRDRRKAGLDPLIYGNLMHYILEYIVQAYIARNYRAFTDEELKALVEAAADKFIKEELGGDYDKTKKFMFLYKRSESRALKVAAHLMDELRQSKFKPMATELEIGAESGPEALILTDKNGSSITVNGKIDRVDIMESESGAWVRVIDYKTGTKEFRLNDVLNGLNMQMLIYLMTVAKNGGMLSQVRLDPAAVLYMKSDIGRDSVEKEGGESRESLEKKAEKKSDGTLALEGLCVDDSEVTQGMNTVKGRKFVKADQVTVKQLSMIFDIVEEKLRSMSEGLDSGEIPAYPAKVEGERKMMCTWCEFADICRRERTDGMNIIAKMDTKEAAKELEKAKKEEGESNG